MSKPTILVLGSTGAIGTAVTKALLAKKIHFRAGVHNVTKAENLKKQGVDVVAFEYYDPESVKAALAGISKVFLLTPPGQTIVPGQTLIQAAKAAGVKHIVKLSGLGADAPAFFWAHEHLQVEQDLKASGITYTILRPSTFFSNVWYDQHSLKHGKIYKYMKQDSRVNWISNDDIADVAVAALTEKGHEGKTYTLTGPENITADELAKLYSEAFGKPVEVVLIDEATLRERAKSYLPAQAIDGYVNCWAYFKSGGYDKQTNDVKEVLQREPKKLRDYLKGLPADQFK